MGNTTFYQEAKHGDAKVVWRDLFSESFKKHSSAERAYALSVGTPLNQSTEETMLKKWHKPWLWFTAAKFGIGFFVLTLALMLLMPMLGFSIAGVEMFYIVVLPQIVPLIVMVFLWELNIPQNISIWEMIGFFLVGGLLSFVFLNPLFRVFGNELPASFAALREEPPKLAAAVVLLAYLDKKAHKKIYGVTGLVVGAAVGAGFAALESVQYALSSGGGTVLLRALVGVGGHMVYAAPYVAAYASGLRKTGSYWKPLLRRDFLLAFAGSILLHGLWNSSFNSGYVSMILMVAAKWAVLFFWVRKYLVEIIDTAQSRYYGCAMPAAGGVRPAAQLTVTCVRGAARGQRWNCSVSPLVFGRDGGCNAMIPGNAAGVSRQHCVIRPSADGFTIQDLNSTYGTYLTSGRLPAGVTCALADGEHIYLGSRDEEFRVTIQ